MARGGWLPPCINFRWWIGKTIAAFDDIDNEDFRMEHGLSSSILTVTCTTTVIANVKQYITNKKASG